MSTASGFINEKSLGGSRSATCGRNPQKSGIEFARFFPIGGGAGNGGHDSAVSHTSTGDQH